MGPKFILFLQILAIFTLFSIPFIALSQIAASLSPETWVSIIQNTYILLFFIFILYLIIQTTLIPLRWIRDTEKWWIFSNVWIPKIITKVAKPYKRVMEMRGWLLFGSAVVGLVWFARLGLEVDLFFVVVTHWLALLAASTRQEEWAEGGRFLAGNWKSILELFGILLLIRAY